MAEKSPFQLPETDYNFGMSPKLSQEQREALQRHPGQPIEVEDEQDHAIYVLIARDQFRKEQGGRVDRDKIKQAILARRDESRQLNEDWEPADRQVWNTET